MVAFIAKKILYQCHKQSKTKKKVKIEGMVSMGQSGRLLIFWREGINIDLI